MTGINNSLDHCSMHTNRRGQKKRTQISLGSLDTDISSDSFAIALASQLSQWLLQAKGVPKTLMRMRVDTDGKRPGKKIRWKSFGMRRLLRDTDVRRS